MLHRSFKPAKCKTALKLAVSRTKLLNNKREAQIKLIKRELAQLIESGQIQTARIRVEHVIREEKSTTAYNLIEIYCELIAARLPIIESQKTCPIDLKEAVSSVIYACPRCSDIPELADIKKHLTAKYGKEFVHNAIDLRPDCGVNRMLVEKLSAKAPDGPTKLKVLTAIAEEHNIKWNPETFSESDPKPPQDLLNGPNMFETASRIHTEAPPSPAQPTHVETVQPHLPNIQVPPKQSERTDASRNNEDNPRSSSGYQNFASVGVSRDSTTTSSTSHSEERPSGTRTDRVEHHEQSYHRNDNDWVMQFKDAASAAQAAAESAERASLAARAAAELSRQHSPRLSKPHDDESRDELSKSYMYDPKSESPRVYAGSKFQSEERNSSYGGDSAKRDEHIVEKGREELSRPSENNGDRKAAPVKSTIASTDYPRNRSNKSYEIEFFDEVSRKSQANDYDSKYEAKIQDNAKSDQVSYFDQRETRRQSSNVSHHSHHSHSRSRSHTSSISDDQEEVLRKKNDATHFEERKSERQPSRASSRSHSSNSGDIHVDIFKRNEPSEEDPLVREDSGSYRRSPETNSKVNTARFDNYDSGDDHNKIDLLNYGEQDISSRYSPPSGKASLDILADSSVWSPRRNTDEVQRRSTPHFHPSIFSGSSEVSSQQSQPDPSQPTPAYDDYDSQNSSDSEQDRRKSERIEDTTNLQEIPSVNTVPANEGCNYEDNGVKSRPISDIKFDDEELPTHRRVSTITKSGKEEVYDFSKDSELLSDSSSGSGSELKLGSLVGGFRNKANRRPPYMRKQSGSSFGARETTKDDCSEKQSQSSSRSQTVQPLSDPRDGNSEERRSSKQSKKTSMRTFTRRTDPDDDSSEEELQQDTRINRPSFNQKSGIEINKKPSSRSPPTYFDSDSSDDEEKVSKSRSPINTRPGSVFSRRTKISSPIHNQARSKTADLYEESATSNHRSESKPYSGSRSQSKPVLSSSERTSPTTYGAKKESPFTISNATETLPNATTARVFSKPTVSSRQSETPNRGVENRFSSRSSHVSEALPKTNVLPANSREVESKSYDSNSVAGESTTKPASEIKISMRSREQRRSVEREGPKPTPEPKRSSRAETSKSTSSEMQKSNSPPKKSGKSEDGKASKSLPSVSRETSAKDSSASHVHPNLPDSDAFTAFFQGLRQPRQ